MKGDSQVIRLTDNAKEYLSSIANDDHITLGVKGGGCSGFTYVWDYKKNWPDVNWGKPIDDLLVLDPMAEMFVAGCTIDYVKELGGSYLKVVNPNATASCGCGESFAVQGNKMVEALIASILGSFVYDNIDFFKTSNKQVRDGYRWEMNIKERNPDVPAIPLIREDNGKQTVIWVLEK